MIRCAACNRKLTAPAGFVGLLPLGPVCLQKLRSIKPRRTRAGQVVRSDEMQADLFAPANPEPVTLKAT